MRGISLHLTEGQIQCLAELVRRRLYPNRSEAIRLAVRELVNQHLTSNERLKIGWRASK